MLQSIISYVTYGNSTLSRGRWQLLLSLHQHSVHGYILPGETPLYCMYWLPASHGGDSLDSLHGAGSA